MNKFKQHLNKLKSSKGLITFLIFLMFALLNLGAIIWASSLLAQVDITQANASNVYNNNTNPWYIIANTKPNTPLYGWAEYMIANPSTTSMFDALGWREQTTLVSFSILGIPLTVIGAKLVYREISARAKEKREEKRAIELERKKIEAAKPESQKKLERLQEIAKL